jgi:hypothetical protein
MSADIQGFWVSRLLINSYDRSSAPPDDVGRQKGCKVRIARNTTGTDAISSSR